MQGDAVTAPPAVFEGFDRLPPTEREIEVLELCSEGLGNREIGQRLYLSHRTVGSHLYRIFPKLGVTSRNQLAAVVGER